MATGKDNIAKAVNAFHRTMFSLSGGVVGGRVAGMPVVMLTTTGRKSGKKRTTMLTSPLVDDDRVVLVASYGGDPRHPTWFLNLRDNPDVEISMRGRRGPMRAHVASPDEKSELWPKVVQRYKGYGRY